MSTRILVQSELSLVRNFGDKKFQHLEFHIVDLEEDEVHLNISRPLFACSGLHTLLHLGELVYMFGGCKTSKVITDIDSCVSENPTDTFYTGSALLRLTSDDSGEWCKNPKPIFGPLFANATCLGGKIYDMGFWHLCPQLFNPATDSWEDITLPSELQGCTVSLFVLPDPSNDRIILHLEKGSLSSPSICAYYPNSDEWKRIVSDFPGCAWDPVSAVADDVVYFNYDKCHTLVAAYDLKNLKWLDVHLSHNVVNGCYIIRENYKNLMYLGDNSFCLAVPSNQSSSIRCAERCLVLFVKFRVERRGSVINIVPLLARSFIFPRTSYVCNMVALRGCKGHKEDADE
ncbi:uncharacterized protein LOC108199473 isoform X2 [Daucus carota subsp. sativus]|uniref:uncharacterized protein LOC108199473 isoform X2 n=1 Tax=Daucus carota subsp. sativus TaxID=79200 RepID=UPI0007EF1C14|nr:PREDICTED: uncharacterized protein LOC108199473 isoform X1 [Daucus carota subsp. sativus]